MSETGSHIGGTLLVPAAGSSARFGGGRPKWMLTHPDGSSMMERAVKSIASKFDRLVIGIQRQHLDMISSLDELVRPSEIGGLKAELVLFDGPTAGQPMTVAIMLERAKVSGPMMVKDCDNSWDFGPQDWHRAGGESFSHWLAHDEHILASVAMVSLHVYPDVASVAQKGFVTGSADFGLSREKVYRVSTARIVDGAVVSHLICVGGYWFRDASVFTRATSLTRTEIGQELRMSHVFAKVDESFCEGLHVCRYEDYGTRADWDRYCSGYANMFLDIDGVLLENTGRFTAMQWGDGDAIEANRWLASRGPKRRIILLTSRPESMRAMTVSELANKGIAYDQLVMGLLHAPRFAVNDYADSTQYPTVQSVCIPRNSVCPRFLS